MAGSARYTAVLDANVLYPTLVRDMLMSLATADLYHARWTSQIHDEWTRALAKNRPDIAEKLPDVVTLMNRAVPDCLIENYESLIPAIQLPDANDRHVVAAAIRGHADAIVTFDVDDFPLDELSKYKEGLNNSVAAVLVRPFADRCWKLGVWRPFSPRSRAFSPSCRPVLPAAGAPMPSTSCAPSTRWPAQTRSQVARCSSSNPGSALSHSQTGA